MKNENITLSDIIKAIKKQVEERGGLWSKETIFKQFIAESGELADALMDFDGEKPVKKGKAPTNIGHEAADVVYALICLCMKYEIDFEKALIEKIGINQERDKDRFEK